MTYQLEAVEPCRPSRQGWDRGRCVWLVGPHEHLPGGHSPLPEARNKYRYERSDCGFIIEGEGAFEIWTSLGGPKSPLVEGLHPPGGRGVGGPSRLPNGVGQEIGLMRAVRTLLLDLLAAVSLVSLTGYIAWNAAF